MAKIVYQDGDNNKVARGKYVFEDDFVVVTDAISGTLRIGKRFVVSIKEDD